MSTLKKLNDMKHLKKFENLEEDNSELISELKDILQELEDEYFDIIIVDRNRKNNYCILITFLKDTSGGRADEFRLYEIKSHFERVLQYMKSNGFYIEDVGAFDLTKNIEVSKDPNQWNLNTKVLGLNFYFN